MSALTQKEVLLVMQLLDVAVKAAGLGAFHDGNGAALQVVLGKLDEMHKASDKSSEVQGV